MCFFEDSGYISLMIRENGFPISSPVTNLTSNSSWAFCVSLRLRFSAASSSVTLIHMGGGVLRCRSSESLRAKKSPRMLPKELFDGCASMVSQCRLKSSHFLNFVSGQSRHLIPLIISHSQLIRVAASSAWCSMPNGCGMSNTSSLLPLVAAAAAPCCQCGAPLPLPLPHSPRPESSVHSHLLLPNPAGNSFPAGINGEFPVCLGSRASPLRVLPPWVCC